MSAFIPFGGGSGTPVNPDYTLEVLGSGTNAAGTLMTAGTTNVIGSPATIGVTVGAWVGMWVNLMLPSTVTARYLTSISLDNGASYKDPIYCLGGGTRAFFLPVIVPAGSTILMKCQSSTSGATMRVIVTGAVAVGAIDPPGFSTWEAVIPANTAITATSAVALTPANATTIGNVGSVTAQRYGFFMVNLGTTSTPSTTRSAYLRLGYGGGPTIIGATACPIGAFTDSLDTFSAGFYADVPASTQLQAGIESPNTDGSILIGVLGFR